MDLKDIKAIVDLMKKNALTEFELEHQDFKIKLKRAPGPVASAADEVPVYAVAPQASALPAVNPTRGRIGALKPGFYTRIGAGIRYATQILAKRPESLKLLLILSDGKPNDVDHYEGRYGIEDTRMSLNAARQEGVRPFCVTIDKEGQGYLPHLFGPAGYTILRKPSELPARLPLLYAQLTSA